jgi:branched-chain amino acid transport system ATP-binding protein
MLTGQYKPTAGRVFLKGRDITDLGPALRTKLGMGRSFQLTNIFPLLSVLENVRIAVQSREGFGLNFWRNYRHFSEVEDEAYAILGEVLLNDRWNSDSASLTHGEKRKLEIAILFALKPEILFLDEPTAGMGQEEVPAILEILNKIKDARDRTILLVEHKMDMIMSLSDTIMVLQEGRLIADGAPDEIYRNKAVQEAYLGGGTTRD